MSQINECKHTDYKLCFTLKQHTPMIHFQADQKGATLRATELKPKLDRFLIEHAFENDFEKYKKYLIGYKENLNENDFKGKKAFDYKVKIQRVIPIISDIKEFRSYFGNMGITNDNEMYRKSSFTDKSFKIEFLSFNKFGLLDNVLKYFASLLAVTNFGTRQSKGFGSFYISSNDQKYIKPQKALEIINQKYVYGTYSNKNPIDILKYTIPIYALMKTGMNYPDYPKKDHPRGLLDYKGNIKQVPDPTKPKGNNASYYKSFLFMYMLKKNPKIGNEKRYIKEKFFNHNKKIENDGIDKKYTRALLGLGDGIEFNDHERKGKISYSHTEIKRFKSPFTFKIIDNYLYILVEEIDSRMFNATFNFKYIDTNEPISTPTKEEFNIIDFLDKYVDYFNTLKPVYKNNNLDDELSKAKNTRFIKVLS